MNNRLINTKVAGGGGCTDIVDNYDPFGGNGVALYQFNGDLTDVSTNWNLSASGVNYPSGAFGQAVAGNIIPNPSWGMETSSQITISWWGRSTDGIAEIWGYLGQAGDNPLIRLSNGSIRFEGNGSQIDHSFTAPAVGTNWNHYAITIDCSTGFINHYRNSEQLLVNADAGTSTLIGNLSGYGFFSGSSNTYSGQNVELDQVRIFNTALTPLEVEALYTEELCICDGTVDTLDILGDGSCIATYQLDGNANDLSGNYSGTPTDVSYGVGEFDLAGVFNGSTSGINLGNGLVSSLTALSTSIWFNTNDISLNAQILLDLGFSSTGNGLQIYIGSVGNIIYRVSSGGSNVFQEVINGVISNNTWYNITATFENTTSGAYKLYLNNSLIASGNSSQTGSISFASTGLYLGHYNQTFSRFDGEIDQVRIFNKALNSTEVTTLYNETACDALACSGTTNTLDILSDGSCIAAYHLDGSPADLSGNYNGVQTDVTYPVGNFDLAGSFNGTSSRIEVPFASKPNLSTCTVSFWLKTTSTNTQALVGEGYSSGFWGNFQSYISSNKLNVRTGNASNAEDNFWQSTSDVNTGSWVHCAVSMEGNTSKIYINGNLETTKTLTITRAATTQPFTIGQFYANGTLFSSWTNDCLIDQVRIFNKALSAGEVTTLYNETPCN